MFTLGFKGGVPVTVYFSPFAKFNDIFSDGSSDGSALPEVLRLGSPRPISIESSSDEPCCEKSGNARRKADVLI